MNYNKEQELADMGYTEADPLPKECQNCKEEGWGCDECDFLLMRYLPIEKDIIPKNICQSEQAAHSP